MNIFLRWGEVLSGWLPVFLMGEVGVVSFCVEGCVKVGWRWMLYLPIGVRVLICDIVRFVWLVSGKVFS